MAAQGLITAGEAARLLNVSAGTVNNWVRHGYLTRARKGYLRRDVIRLKKQLAAGTIDRLNQRANRLRLRRTVTPFEYAGSAELAAQAEKIRALFAGGNLDPERALFVLTARLLVLRNEVRIRDGNHLFSARAFTNWRRSSLRAEMTDWLRELDKSGSYDPEPGYADIFSALDRVDHDDIPGVIYQSLLLEGRRSGQGLYYTPADLLDGVFEGRRPAGRFLDPCCGTGQFLLYAARRGRYRPEDLYGLDLDPVAVRLARINLLLAFAGREFSPRIFRADFLDPETAPCRDQRFGMIATNPPWGAAFSPDRRKALKSAYPFISSGESFSFFLAAALDVLENNGRLTFILPESFSNIRAHGDIRSRLLSLATLTGVTFLGRRFTGVQSPVIRIDVKKTAPAKTARTRVILESGQVHAVPQARFLENRHGTIDARLTETEAAVIKRIYDFPHVTLKGAADWGLGIVTGDNRKYLSDKCRDGMEPVFRGKDIAPYRLNPPGAFLRFTPERFQQTAPEGRYRASEKLVYRFISSRLVFACDNSGSLTLNSANILIPKIAGYPVKAVLGVLNSRVCGFVFAKKFQTHRILRGDLETLPLPLLGAERLKALAELADRATAGEDAGPAIDDLIMTGLALTEEQRRMVLGVKDE
jgi:SAM-dependent methyltransferase